MAWAVDRDQDQEVPVMVIHTNNDGQLVRALFNFTTFIIFAMAFFAILIMMKVTSEFTSFLYKTLRGNREQNVNPVPPPSNNSDKCSQGGADIPTDVIYVRSNSQVNPQEANACTEKYYGMQPICYGVSYGLPTAFPNDSKFKLPRSDPRHPITSTPFRPKTNKNPPTYRRRLFPPQPQPSTSKPAFSSSPSPSLPPYQRIRIVAEVIPSNSSYTHNREPEDSLFPIFKPASNEFRAQGNLASQRHWNSQSVSHLSHLYHTQLGASDAGLGLGMPRRSSNTNYDINDFRRHVRNFNTASTSEFRPIRRISQNPYDTYATSPDDTRALMDVRNRNISLWGKN